MKNTIFNLWMRFLKSEVGMFAQVYFWTAIAIIFVLGALQIATMVSGYRVEITHVITSPVR